MEKRIYGAIAQTLCLALPLFEFGRAEKMPEENR